MGRFCPSDWHDNNISLNKGCSGAFHQKTNKPSRVTYISKIMRINVISTMLLSVQLYLACEALNDALSSSIGSRLKLGTTQLHKGNTVIGEHLFLMELFFLYMFSCSCFRCLEQSCNSLSTKYNIQMYGWKYSHSHIYWIKIETSTYVISSMIKK